MKTWSHNSQKPGGHARQDDAFDDVEYVPAGQAEQPPTTNKSPAPNTSFASTNEYSAPFKKRDESLDDPVPKYPDPLTMFRPERDCVSTSLLLIYPLALLRS